MTHPSRSTSPTLPSHHLPQVLRILEKRGIVHLAQLIHASVDSLRGWLRGEMGPADLNALLKVARSLPDVRCTVSANSAEFSPGADGCVTVELVSGQRGRRHAFAPRFPKPRPEGGWCAQRTPCHCLGAATRRCSESHAWAPHAPIYTWQVARARGRGGDHRAQARPSPPRPDHVRRAPFQRARGCGGVRLGRVPGLRHVHRPRPAPRPHPRRPVTPHAVKS